MNFAELRPSTLIKRSGAENRAEKSNYVCYILAARRLLAAYSIDIVLNFRRAISYIQPSRQCCLVQAGEDEHLDDMAQCMEARLLNSDFDRAMERVGEVHDLCENHLRANQVPEEDIFAILLGIEEIFTNYVKYNATGKCQIRVGVECFDDKVIATITDFDSHRFDPREAPPAVLEIPLSERKPGGLGIYIVMQMMNEVAYSFRDRVSKVTLTRYIQQNGKIIND